MVLPSAFVIAVSVSAIAAAGLGAQQVTTATIAGLVRGDQQEVVNDAVVRVVHRATGYSFITSTREGRFVVPGLPVGGPYSIVVERIGYRPAKRDSIFLTLGEELQLDFALIPFALTLDTLRVVAAETPGRSFARHGIGVAISDSALHRLPTINRDFYDFARLSPQISARSGREGLSAGGVSVRFNNFSVDGVSERGLLGNFAAGTGQGAKAISLEAIREYQILLSPYDVRYGDFAGGLVNAVTRSGTNELHGTAFVYARDEELARRTDFMRGSPYQRTQFGFAAGGPIVRDRAHFFLATELQRLTEPAKGPYVGQSVVSQDTVLVSNTDLARFADALHGYGIEPGSAGPIEIGNPLVNLFGRFDIAWPEWNSRLVLWSNYSRTESIVFSRGFSASFLTRNAPAFQLSSTGHTTTVSKEVAAAQLYTNLRNGGLNEFLIAFKFQPSVTTPNERAPSISVSVPNIVEPGKKVWLQAGSAEAAHGISLDQTSFEIADHLTLSLGTQHRAAVGARVELLELFGRGRPGVYGYWEFSSLDSLFSGDAARYRLVKDPENRAPHRAAQYSLYVTDEWRPSGRVSVLAGVRADLLARRGRPPYNAAVDSAIGRRTTDINRELFTISPRIGFDWDITGDGRSHVRGGAGVFVSRPPMGWLGAAFQNYGNGVSVLLCDKADRPAPRFVPDYQNQPNTCANGRGPTGGPVDLEDKELRLAETVKTSLAYDRVLPGRVVATMEALYTRNLADFAFVNLNLAGPQGVDRHGRVLYGTFLPSGNATQAVTTEFSEVIELRNHSRNHSWQLALRLEKRFSDRLEATASYAYSRVRDVQTPPDGFQAFENWRRGRVVSGRHDAMNADISALDIPHHVVFAGTISMPWQQWATDVSFYYVGESGSPFTYLATSAGNKGDLNADGTNLNDPIYIPRTTSDSAEIIFDGIPAVVAAQQADFDRFIEDTECLRRQRGRIMARNSCRAPWVHITNASLRQTLPVVRGHRLVAQLDIFNVLNLLNQNWGLLRVVDPAPNPPLLEHVRQTPGAAATSQPIFRFDPAKTRFDSQNVESAFQLQLALRYSF